MICFGLEARMYGPELPPGWRWNHRGRYAIATYTAGGVGYALQITTAGDVPHVSEETTEDPERIPPGERGTEGELAYRRALINEAREVVDVLRRWLVDHPAPGPPD